jgi:predicted RNA binding protein YcfA (HicA-like mRNA interferase family)
LKLPRDLNGEELAKGLTKLGFLAMHQSGSHILIKHTDSGETISIPAHRPLKVGTLAGLLKDVREITGLSREEILRKLN